MTEPMQPIAAEDADADTDVAGEVDAGAGDVPAAAIGGGTPGAPAGALRDARVAWVVAVLAMVVAGIFGYQWWALAGEAEDREQAREAAEVMAARITTFEGVAIDDFVEQLGELATGDYARQVRELFSPDFRDALRDNEVESVGEVTRSFVQELDGYEAEVFVVVRQTSVNAVVRDPVVDELRMDITLAREGGRWLVADVGVLGPAPSPVTAPPPPAGSEAEDDQG
jgi:hypothetical protein